MQYLDMQMDTASNQRTEKLLKLKIDLNLRPQNLNLDTCKELDVLPCSKEDLIKNSDFLSIHVQGGERYKNCITIKEMDKMKKTSFL